MTQAQDTGRPTSRLFASLATWLSRWVGSHWAVLVAAVIVVVSLALFGTDDTNIAISIATLLLVFVLQNSQNRHSAALHVKLDEIITHLEGPRDDVAGIEVKSHDEIEELQEELAEQGDTSAQTPAHARLRAAPSTPSWEVD